VLEVPRTLTMPLTLDVSAATGNAQLAAELRYDAADPFAVTLAIGMECDEPVVWVFARALLANGIGDSAGEGDITIEPAADLPGRMLRITLATDCLATMLAPTDPVVEFLVESFARVPSGTESDHVDFEAEIASLLG
jgi:Streptomyces sporulation and cell division protein, SsgA